MSAGLLRAISAHELLLIGGFHREGDGLTHPVDGFIRGEAQHILGHAGGEDACAADAGVAVDDEIFAGARQVFHGLQDGIPMPFGWRGEVGGRGVDDVEAGGAILGEQVPAAIALQLVRIGRADDEQVLKGRDRPRNSFKCPYFFSFATPVL